MADKLPPPDIFGDEESIVKFNAATKSRHLDLNILLKQWNESIKPEKEKGNDTPPPLAI